ncbi:apolipoprotein acyltransferase [Paracoccus sp. 11-3]|uniref:Apolipoprotein acyltransferase n=2 Tax=Paracoccus amoyensis TaxID=2760093 RepID=A0A926GE31_9RHOB|nr:apolipoprotein acyltransferase [Paracoccus amoyensis]
MVARTRVSVYLLLQEKITRKAQMILIAAVVIGAFLGWRRAGQVGGNTRDKAQYAIAFALAFAIVGLLATVIIDRMI